MSPTRGADRLNDGPPLNDNDAWLSIERVRPLRVRHNETFRTRTDQNGREQTETQRVKIGARRSGPEQTGTRSPLSGPRYRGSNPCLPAIRLACIERSLPSTLLREPRATSRGSWRAVPMENGPELVEGPNPIPPTTGTCRSPRWQTLVHAIDPAAPRIDRDRLRDNRPEGRRAAGNRATLAPGVRGSGRQCAWMEAS